MKIQIVLLLLFLKTASFACGPWFPPSYIQSLDSYFVENINVPVEIELIAKEYGLLDLHRYWDRDASSTEVDQNEFKRAANSIERADLIDGYNQYLKAVRSGSDDASPSNLPEQLAEFGLYLEGVKELRIDPDVACPRSWERLLELDATNRFYRTTWVHYMLGNLASSRGEPEKASEQYKACREAACGDFEDNLGLAHSTFKNEYRAQTNAAKRIDYGVRAVAYYEYACDRKRMKHCLEHLEIDVKNAPARTNPEITDQVQLETLALFLFGNREFMERLETAPPLQISSRLAWFMYKSGEIEKCSAYLDQCPERDVLANWLRFRIAQRNADTAKAIACLKKWLNDLQSSNRIYYEFSYKKDVSPRAATYGNLGTLFVTQGDMEDALVSFVKAGAFEDAALIAERYLDTKTLKAYVDTFKTRQTDFAKGSYYERYQLVNSQSFMERHLAYLLARRLFREGRPWDALPFYPPALGKLLQEYMSARSKADNIWASRNERSAHLFHAARIMRWKGMELSGTEMEPDYRIFEGNFYMYNFGNEITESKEALQTYASTAPSPDIRFHYRHVAADLADQAASLAWNKHQRATILWTAGKWLQNRHPKDADIYYKKLAKISSDPLAKAADQKRWFPEITPSLSYVYYNEEYIDPKILAQAASEYSK